MNKLHLVKNPYSGMLITFCGLDGCGKTTLIEHLVEYYRSMGIEPVVTKQPTPAMRKTAIFRTYMDCPDHDAFDYRCLSLMAAADRIQHIHEVIVPALMEGKVVISDRYFYSCLANLKARGYEYDKWIYDISKTILKPDIPFFIDVPLETALLRVRSRAEEKNRYIDMTLQRKLFDEYHCIAEQEKAPVLNSGKPLLDTIQDMIHCVEKKTAQRRPAVMNPYVSQNSELYNRIIDYMAQFTSVPTRSIHLNSALIQDMGVDSLGLANMIIGLEDTFDIELEEDDLNPERMRTVENIVSLVFKYIHK